MNARLVRAGLAVGGVAFGLYGYHLLRHDLHSPVPNAVASVGVAWTFLAAGIVAWARRPESRVGILMTFVGFCLLERKLQYSHQPAAFTFGFLFGELGITAAFAHAVLSYPSGRLRTSFERRFIAASYAVVIGFSLALLTIWDHRRTCIWNDTYCSTPRPRSLLAIHGDPQLFDAIRDTYKIGVYGVLAVVFIGLIVRRVVRSTHAGRRLLAPLMLAAAFAATRAVSEAILGFLPHSHVASEALYWWQIAGQVAVPLALLAGLLTAQLARGTVADLVVELANIQPGEVRDALARALNDPSLQVAYWLPMRQAYVDVAGRPLELPEDGLGVTRLEDVAAIVHDSELDPDLVEAAGAAARLALHNARLQADVRAQLDKVQESRRRIVTAGDEQRRKIERDLHDGAQQRLVALALELRMAQRQLGTGDAELERVLADAVGELQVAVEELRELARGVHPAVLTEEGLAVALESLATRTPLPVEIAATLEGRLPAEIEAAAYFVACEAIANAVKHSRATGIRVSAQRRNGKLVIEIEDDGIGGAKENGGSGLRGLVDRVEAHGGTLRVESDPGRGTRVIGELPCAS
ncbi:MAG TPA: sensor histidine kinase [Gaiellaceae bacterium]